MTLRRDILKISTIMCSKEIEATKAIKISPELSERANKIINEFISLGGRPIVSINNKNLTHYPDIYFTISCYQNLEKWYHQRWMDNPSRVGYSFADGKGLNPFEITVKEILGYNSNNKSRED